MFGVPFPSYMTLLLAGFVVASALGAYWLRREGRDGRDALWLGLISVVLGLVGGRVLHILVDSPTGEHWFRCVDPSRVGWQVERGLCETYMAGVWDAAGNVCRPKARDCSGWFHPLKGGYVFYGGLVAASAGAWAWIRRRALPFRPMADMAGFAIAVGLVFGRVGCLLAGCCFGSTTTSVLGVSFPKYSPASASQFRAGLLDAMSRASLPVQPTQAYEAALCLAIAAFLFRLQLRRRYEGEVFVLFLTTYAIGRFLIEFLRADERGAWSGFSTSQWLSLGAIGVAGILHRNWSHTPQGHSATQ